MAKKCPDPEWYTFIEDFNKKEIIIFNVFRSHNFLEGCKRTFKRFKETERIEKEIKNWALYSFCSKFEYEIVITSLSNSDNFNERKIDVYDQLMLNWDAFFKYVLEHKAYFLRRNS